MKTLVLLTVENGFAHVGTATKTLGTEDGGRLDEKGLAGVAI